MSKTTSQPGIWIEPDVKARSMEELVAMNPGGIAFRALVDEAQEWQERAEAAESALERFTRLYGADDAVSGAYGLTGVNEQLRQMVVEAERRAEKAEAIVQASLKMHRFNQESRKVMSTATSPTHKTILIRERTQQEIENYQAWESAVEAWEAEHGRGE